MEAPIRDRSYNEKLNYFLLPVLLVAAGKLSAFRLGQRK